MFSRRTYLTPASSTADHQHGSPYAGPVPAFPQNLLKNNFCLDAEELRRSDECEKHPDQAQSQKDSPHAPEGFARPAWPRVPVHDGRKSQDQSDHDEHYRQLHAPRLGQAPDQWACSRPEGVSRLAGRTRALHGVDGILVG